MLSIEIKDIYIYVKSLEINKNKWTSEYDEKFYKNIDKIINDAKFFENILQEKQSISYGYGLDPTYEYQKLENEYMNSLIFKIYKNIDDLFNRNNSIFNTTSLSILNKLKAIILKPLLTMIDKDEETIKINDIEFYTDSISETLFYIITSIIFNVIGDNINANWIRDEYNKQILYSKLESFIYTEYIKEMMRTYKNIDNNLEEKKWYSGTTNNKIGDWNIVKILNRPEFFENNIPNFILVLLFGINSYKDESKFRKFTLSLDDCLIKLNGIFEKIDDKAFNNLNLFMLNKVGSKEYIKYSENSNININNLVNDPETLEIMNSRFIYGLYDQSNENIINWTMITNIIIGYLIEKKIKIKPDFLFQEIFSKLTQSDTYSNEALNNIMLDSISPYFIKNSKNFLSQEVLKKIKINNSKKYDNKKNGELLEYFNVNLKYFYENEFKKELINFLDRYYKDHYNINNYKSDLDHFYIILIDILYSNFKIFEQDKKSLDYFLYAWIYFYDMRGYYFSDSFKSNDSINYYYTNFFTENKHANSVISTSYDDKNIISLMKKYIGLDEKTISKINLIVFVDNNMLSSEDRINFNHMECTGDLLYKIIILHLKLNAKINPDNKIDYFAQKFQDKLCKSLNISKIVQSNGLHFGAETTFPDADYFEAFLYDFYIKNNYKETYELIKDLFEKNCNDYIVDKDILQYIEEDYNYPFIDNKSFLTGENHLRLLLYYKFNTRKSLLNDEQQYKIVRKLLNLLFETILSFTILSKEDKSQKFRSLVEKINIVLSTRIMDSFYGENTYDYLKVFSMLEENGLEKVIEEIINIYENLTKDKSDEKV